MRASLFVLAIGLGVGACGSVNNSGQDGPAGDDDGGGDGGAGDGPLPIDAPDNTDAPQATCNPVSGTNVVLAPFVTGLELPLMITGAPNDPRQFVIEQDGRIRVIKNGAVLPAPYLDLTGPVLSGGERGLLGIAFHPNFTNNGLFYVHFTADAGAGDHTIAEYHANPSSDTADANSRRDLLVFDDPFSNHNGGMLEFGNDGMLYIAIGDGGSGGDPGDRAQNDASLFGKLLRIDVDARTGTKPYGIPADNPFANSPDGANDPRPEIWHKGLRNPFRFSFDRANGNVYIGDVGQNAWEEVNVAANTPGINWGWDDREGAHCFEPTTGCLTASRREPVTEHAAGANWHAIIGGQVYRGACFPDLVGTYFYGDYTAQELWAFTFNGSAALNDRRVVPAVGEITAIHADSLGELYVVTHNGVIRRITAAP